LRDIRGASSQADDSKLSRRRCGHDRRHGAYRYAESLEYSLQVGRTPLSERLIRALEAQTAAQTEEIATCEQLIDCAADPTAKILLELVVEEQQRHRSLLQRMVRRLQSEVEFTASPTALPVPSDECFSGGEQTVTNVRGLIRDEREGARYLRHLARQQSDVYDGLYAVLLECMARDDEKHTVVLRYLLRRLEARANRPAKKGAYGHVQGAEGYG
jgi:hypothetical protein